LVRHLPGWTVYELAHPTPILTSAGAPGAASVLALTDSRIRLWLPAAGAYDLRVRYSPYWSTDTSGVCLSPTTTGMTHIATPTPGPLTIEFEPTLATVAAAAASDSSHCSS
jgi:hypothetical protein